MIGRREFLGTLAGGLVLPVALPLQSPDPRPPTRDPRPAHPLKHWAGTKSEIHDVDAWRRELAELKAAASMPSS